MPPFVLASEIQPGCYVCVKTKSLFGKVIRTFTRSPFDHAFIILGDGLIAEATVWGTRIDHLDTYKGQLAVANTAEPVAPWQRQEITDAARHLKGRKYNWAAIAVIALRLAGLKQKWLLKAADDRDADICSEDVCLAGAAAGLDWQCGQPDPAIVEPSQLAARKPFMTTVVWD